jgi:hypothetical protein
MSRRAQFDGTPTLLNQSPDSEDLASERGGPALASAARPRPGRLWRLTATTLLLLTVLHFGLISVVLAVPTVIPAAAWPAVDGYLVPFFDQSWRLFAPMPDIHDYAVFARGGARRNDQLEWTPWLSLVDPLVASVQANRLAPEIVRLNVVYKAAARTFDYAGSFSALALGRDAVADRWASVERQPASLIVLERLASAALLDAEPNRPLEMVQVMISARQIGVDAATGESLPAKVLLLHPVLLEAVRTR